MKQGQRASAKSSTPEGNLSCISLRCFLKRLFSHLNSVNRRKHYYLLKMRTEAYCMQTGDHMHGCRGGHAVFKARFTYKMYAAFIIYYNPTEWHHFIFNAVQIGFSSSLLIFCHWSTKWFPSSEPTYCAGKNPTERVGTRFLKMYSLKTGCNYAGRLADFR